MHGLVKLSMTVIVGCAIAAPAHATNLKALIPAPSAASRRQAASLARSVVHPRVHPLSFKLVHHAGRFRVRAKRTNASGKHHESHAPPRVVVLVDELLNGVLHQYVFDHKGQLQTLHSNNKHGTRYWRGESTPDYCLSAEVVASNIAGQAKARRERQHQTRAVESGASGAAKGDKVTTVARTNLGITIDYSDDRQVAAHNQLLMLKYGLRRR